MFEVFGISVSWLEAILFFLIIIVLGQLQDIKTILRAIKRKFVDEVDEQRRITEHASFGITFGITYNK